MQKKPLVSIIINCLNGEKYLDKAIKSVLVQNYQNWEIVFFDNNSIDKSYLILKKYKDRRIKYYKSKKTYPLYKARNLAIKKSKGELISFLDVDDWWIKSKLKKQVEVFLADQTVDVLYSNVYLFNDKKKTKKIFIKKKLSYGKITQKLIDKFEMPILSTLIKKNIFNQIKFDNRYTIIGDLDFFVRLSLIKNITAIQEPLAYYRIHDSNLTKKRIDLNIKELESWVSEKVKNKKFKSNNFSEIYNLIKLLRIKKNIIEGNKITALKLIFQKPFKILYLKYIFLSFAINK
jgi:glycosyltransferase involved in cell wall biosynthesis|tara:strand:- start:617 stop:1486 length:870 start_codon:yes stop_codon:yes gene_type:complete